jgi:hypothetical protein
MAWRVFAASATGSSHREDGRPCQDAFRYRVLGDLLVASVCDGAGSCELSHEGARFFSESVVQGLATRIARGDLLREAASDAFKAIAEHVIAEARDGLAALASRAGKELSAYAATLVAAVAWPGQGHFLHVGDGYAVARAAAAQPSEIVSLPENGEYVNETYFVTGQEWRQHLRTTEIDRTVASIVLMSDGAAPFAMAKGHQSLHRPFIDPVERYLDQVSETDGAQALASTLEDPRTDGITNDDKTLLIARWA